MKPSVHRITLGALFSIIFFVSCAIGQTMEFDTDQPGMDYTSFDLSTPDPKICENACNENLNKCKAWTYVKPGVQGPKARCWLKWGTPAPVKDTRCISGILPAPPKKAVSLKKKTSPQEAATHQAKGYSHYYMPDLIVKDITLVDACMLQFTIKNIGKGGVNQNIKVAYGKAGGPNERSADFAPGNLKNPGGEATYVFKWIENNVPNWVSFPVGKVLRVEVNPDRTQAESNYTNNSLTKTLKCLPPLVDMIIKEMSMTGDCKIQLVTKNIGPSSFNDSGWVRISYINPFTNQEGNADFIADLRAGGESTFVIPLLRIGKDPITMTLTVVPVPFPSPSPSVTKTFSDSNYNNNSLTKTLQCVP